MDENTDLLEMKEETMTRVEQGMIEVRYQL